MAVRRAVGQQASVKKYDILSAMMVYGLAQEKQRQKLVMRLLALITTRYNWRSDELTMGHKEIARLWSVDPRTVKREMAKMRSLGWITVKRQGARGRVSTYGMCFDNLLETSRPHWPAIGPDFEERAATLLPSKAPETTVVKVAFGTDGPAPEEGPPETAPWRDLRAALRAQDSAIFEAWFARLEFVGYAEGELVVRAPSDFVARYIDTHLSRMLFECAQIYYSQLRALRFQV
ncbi:hypothetical protein GCM10007939_21020 [Amylibacter marinus]|uniref:DnaA N-terminal domain-containing protein n=1 Tax=Amylibacter marinus TaxID=1475483 RepID=A0ABQ5VX76_9RHOB|nr:DnaA N-terminal domain-containing protein [Amylibacter marinus]GLQ35819.1 hypothetical protein GCM10007939_21020 [Amylibacter marinus]